MIVEQALYNKLDYKIRLSSHNSLICLFTHSPIFFSTDIVFVRKNKLLHKKYFWIHIAIRNIQFLRKKVGLMLC